MFALAEYLHINFYESQFGERAMRRRLRDVEEFVEKMDYLLRAEQ